MTNYDTRQLVDRYRIKLTDRKVESRYKPLDYTSYNRYAYEYLQDYVQYESHPVLVMEISEAEFEQIANKVCEFDDLMRDPETAQLLMEARFINRLKGRF
jgi:uncharacterized iron-regulated protein